MVDEPGESRYGFDDLFQDIVDSYIFEKVDDLPEYQNGDQNEKGDVVVDDHKAGNQNVKQDLNNSFELIFLFILILMAYACSL